MFFHYSVERDERKKSWGGGGGQRSNPFAWLAAVFSSLPSFSSGRNALFFSLFLSLSIPFLTCSTLEYELVLTAAARTETTARRGTETAC